jgi:tRNA-dihydrouridine synthase B
MLLGTADWRTGVYISNYPNFYSDSVLGTFMNSIGGVKIRGRLVLAPMFRVSTLPFRLMCHEYGCGLVYSEMLNGNAIERQNKSSLRMARSCAEERPVAMQLFGTKEDVMVSAAKRLECDIIDFNCGCPDANVMRQGAGAALMKRPKKIGEIIKALVEGQDKPVTLKSGAAWLQKASMLWR